MDRSVCNAMGSREAVGMSIPKLLIGAIAWAAVLVIGPNAVAGPRTVLELFTSQGCSSCPPADKLLSEFRNDAAMLALSLPITYWDYLGWKDTLALPSHTARQKAYSQQRGDREVYTPQIVVNGIAQALGSDRTDIERAVEQSQRKVAAALAGSVPLEVSVHDARIDVVLPNESSRVASAEVWLCPLTRSISVGIGRGENRGRMLTYTNVVRGWVRLGTWDGEGETLSVPIDAIKSTGIDAVAILIQTGTAQKPGAILGATVAALR